MAQKAENSFEHTTNLGELRNVQLVTHFLLVSGRQSLSNNTNGKK